MRRTFAVAFILLAALSADAAKRRAVSPGGRCSPGGFITNAFAVGLAVDATHIYYHDELTNTVRRISKDGGQSTALVSLGSDSYTAMILDETHVYVAAFELPEDLTAFPPANIRSVPKAGGTSTVLATNVLFPYQLAVDATHVYWTSVGTFDFIEEEIESDGKVERVAKNGTGREVLVDDLSGPLGLVLDGNDVIFSESGLAVDDVSAGLRRVSKTGGPVTHMNEDTVAAAIVVTGNDLVFYGGSAVTFSNGLFRMPKSGGTVTELIEDEFIVGEPRVRDGKVYYLTADEENEIYTISYVPLTGGAPSVAVTADFGTEDFELDDCAIYYATFDAILAARR